MDVGCRLTVAALAHMLVGVVTLLTLPLVPSSRRPVDRAAEAFRHG